MKLGIPRALIYWKGWGGEFWKEFFTSLGLEVIISPPSNKQIIDRGVKLADQETCFALKTFLGHVSWLDNQTELDRIFIPRLKKNKQGLEYCPKFFALPDLGRLITDREIVSPRLDYSEHRMERIGMNLGKELGVNQNISKAVKSGKDKVEKKSQNQLEDYHRKINSDQDKIVIVSHPYNLYDDYVNLRIREKLNKLGVELILIDQAPERKIEQDDQFPDWHWEFGQEIINQINEVLNYDLAGAIEISSFQCGCDAVLKEFVEKKFKDENIPFLHLLLDEQTAEAGLQTRLEAFVDTL